MLSKRQEIIKLVLFSTVDLLISKQLLVEVGFILTRNKQLLEQGPSCKYGPYRAVGTPAMLAFGDGPIKGNNFENARMLRDRGSAWLLGSGVHARRGQGLARRISSCWAEVSSVR